MAKVCQVTGKRVVAGHRVSHSNTKRKRRFRPNLQPKRLWVPSLGQHVKLMVTAKGLRTIEKRGIDPVIRELLARGERLDIY